MEPGAIGGGAGLKEVKCFGQNDARPGNHKTGENLSKLESCDQKRYRKQLCQESFLLLARALSFWALWGSLSQLPEQMLSPKEPLLKYFLIYSEGAPTGGWK